MKTKIILAVLGLFVLTTMKAGEPVKTGKFINTSWVDYYDEPIQFEEHGIIFYVFLNGDFDFDTPRGKHYNKPGKRYGDKHAYPKGVLIERDRSGKIRRIGNVFISYSYYGKVKRIGSVFIDYDNGRMEYVGNLRIRYGRYGVTYEGSVKGRYHDDDYDYNPRVTVQYKGHHVTWEYGYYDNFFTSNDFYDKYENYDEDDSHYYFKSKDNSNDSENIIIKRKKENLSTKNESRRKLD
jgi:hypothetical protein